MRRFAVGLVVHRSQAMAKACIHHHDSSLPFLCAFHRVKCIVRMRASPGQCHRDHAPQRPPQHIVRSPTHTPPASADPIGAGAVGGLQGSRFTPADLSPTGSSVSGSDQQSISNAPATSAAAAAATASTAAAAAADPLCTAEAAASCTRLRPPGPVRNHGARAVATNALGSLGPCEVSQPRAGLQVERHTTDVASD